jgi:hypothetical protein
LHHTALNQQQVKLVMRSVIGRSVSAQSQQQQG